jgi:hypothetical protein
MKKPTIKPIKHYSTEPIKKAPNYAPYHKLNNVEYVTISDDKGLTNRRYNTLMADMTTYVMKLKDGYYQIFKCVPKKVVNEDATDWIYVGKEYRQLVFEDMDWVKAFIKFKKLSGHVAVKNSASGTWE